MNSFASLFICLLIFQHSTAQNTTNLSYPQIDSFLNLYENKQEFDKGIHLSLEASNISGKQDSLCAEYLEWAAYLYQQKTENKKAIEYYKKALDIFAKTKGINSVRYANTLNFFATFYQKIGLYDKALPLFIQANEVKEKVLGTEHPSFAISLINLAFLQKKMGHYHKALPLYIQANKIYEKVFGTEHPSFAQSINNLAVLHLDMGNYDKALPLFIQNNKIKEKILGTEHPDFAQSINNLAVLHLNMGNYDKALPLFIQANKIKEKVLGTEHPYFAQSINNLAFLHQKMGNHNKALPLFIKANEIKKKVLGTEHPDVATSLNNLATLHQKMSNSGKALPLYIQAKEIRKKALGIEHPSFATSLSNLALLHQEMGNYDQALPLFIQANKIRKKVLGTEHPSFVTSISNLAVLHLNMGNYNLTWNLLDQAINSLSNSKLKQTFNKSWLDSLKTASYSSTKHITQMVNALEIAYTLLERDSSRANIKAKQTNIVDLATLLLSKARNQVSNDKDKLRMLSLSNDWLLKGLKNLTPELNTKKAFNRADQNKSVLLLQATKSEAAYRLGELPDSLIWKDKQLLKKQSQLQAKLIEKRSKEVKDSLRNELNHVNQEIDDFITIIEKNYPKYHKLKYQQVQAKVKDIQALLDDNTVLLEYVIGDSVVHIFCVNKKQIQWKKTFVRNKDLTNRIKRMHQALSNYKTVIENKKLAYSEYTKQAHWFYLNLVAPVLKDKQNIKNLILVTDGALGHLPFEAFLVEKAPQGLTNYHELHYLVSDYNISYNYSATLWKETLETPTPKNNGQILAMAANYNIKLDSAMMDIRLPTDQWTRKHLSPLPKARKEVETLQENYQGFFAFDALASEKIAKEKTPDFAILHFATHGLLDSKRPILSSLAFTEDSDSLESNFWQAHEISKIELNANLVVLSACKTGFGEFEKGNGIASLARAFMYAGASSLIVSLWQVNDYATSEIMKNLYANLADGMQIDEALRQAKLQYMKSSEGIMAHPAFWSPFIQMGNTQPVNIKRKSGGALSWIIGGTILLLLIGGFMMSRPKREVA